MLYIKKSPMDTKTRLNLAFRAKLQQQIDDFESNIATLRLDSQSDTKSSMGDKYETSKAMIQIEIDKISRQLSLLHGQARLLESIAGAAREVAVAGALVCTDSDHFYLSVPLGKLELEGLTYIAISDTSPIGLSMKMLRKNASFRFNEKTYSIKDIV